MYCLLLLNWKCSYNSHFLRTAIVLLHHRQNRGRLSQTPLIWPSQTHYRIDRHHSDSAENICILHDWEKKTGQELELYPAFNSLTVTEVWLCA